MPISQDFIQSMNNPLYRASLGRVGNFVPKQSEPTEQPEDQHSAQSQPAYPQQPAYAQQVQQPEQPSGVMPTVLGAASMAGNLLDVPGGIVRNLATWLPGGAKPLNPLNPILHPLSGEGRIDGRDLLRSHGVIGSKDTGWNFAGGIALEMALDPTTYLGFGVLTKSGKALAKAGLLGDAASAANKTATAAARASGKTVKTIGRRAAEKSMTAKQVLESLPKIDDVARETLDEIAVKTTVPFSREGASAGGVYASREAAEKAVQEGHMAAYMDSGNYNIIEKADGEIVDNDVFSQVMDSRIKSERTYETAKKLYEDAYKAMYGESSLGKSYDSALRSTMSVHMPLSSISKEAIAGRDPRERLGRLIDGAPSTPAAQAAQQGTQAAASAADAAEAAATASKKMDSTSLRDAVLKATANQEETDKVMGVFGSLADAFGESADDFAARAIADVRHVDQNGTVGGLVRFLEDGRALVMSFDAKTPETLVHEFVHVARRHMKGEMLAKAEKVAGVKPGAQWTTKDEEKFVSEYMKSFKKSNRTVKNAVKEALEQGVFSTITKAVTNAYRTVKDKDSLEKGVRTWLDDLSKIKQQPTAKPTAQPAATAAPQVTPPSPVDLNKTPEVQAVNKAREESVAKTQAIIDGSTPPKADPVTESVATGKKPKPKKPEVADTRTIDQLLAAAMDAFKKGPYFPSQIAKKLKIKDAKVAHEVRDRIVSARKAEAEKSLAATSTPPAAQADAAADAPVNKVEEANIQPAVAQAADAVEAPAAQQVDAPATTPSVQEEIAQQSDAIAQPEPVKQELGPEVLDEMQFTTPGLKNVLYDIANTGNLSIEEIVEGLNTGAFKLDSKGRITKSTIKAIMDADEAASVVDEAPVSQADEAASPASTQAEQPAPPEVTPEPQASAEPAQDPVPDATGPAAEAATATDVDQLKPLLSRADAIDEEIDRITAGPATPEDMQRLKKLISESQDLDDQIDAISPNKRAADAQDLTDQTVKVDEEPAKPGRGRGLAARKPVEPRAKEATEQIVAETPVAQEAPMPTKESRRAMAAARTLADQTGNTKVSNILDRVEASDIPDGFSDNAQKFIDQINEGKPVAKKADEAATQDLNLEWEDDVDFHSYGDYTIQKNKRGDYSVYKNGTKVPASGSLSQLKEFVEGQNHGKGKVIKTSSNMEQARPISGKELEDNIHALGNPEVGDRGGVLQQLRAKILLLTDSTRNMENFVASGDGDSLAKEVLSGIIPNSTGVPGFHDKLHDWLKANQPEYKQLVEATNKIKKSLGKRASSPDAMKIIDDSLSQTAKKPKLGSMREDLLKKMDDEIDAINREESAGSQIGMSGLDGVDSNATPFLAGRKELSDISDQESYLIQRKYARALKENLGKDPVKGVAEGAGRRLQEVMDDINAYEKSLPPEQLATVMRQYHDDIVESLAAVRKQIKNSPAVEKQTLQDTLQSLTDELDVVNKKIADIGVEAGSEAVTSVPLTSNTAKAMLDLGKDESGGFRLYYQEAGKSKKDGKARRQQIAKLAGLNVTMDESDHSVGLKLAKWAGVEQDVLEGLTEAKRPNTKKLIGLIQEKLQNTIDKTVGGEKTLFHIPTAAEKKSRIQRYMQNMPAWKEVLSNTKDRDIGMRIAQALDKGESLVMNLAPVRHLIGIFDRRVFGETDLKGQELGRKVFDATEKAVFQFREVLAPMVRTVNQSGFLSESKALQEIVAASPGISRKEARDKAMDLINARNRNIARVLEGVEGRLDPKLFSGENVEAFKGVLDEMRDMMPIRLASENLAGLKGSPLVDIFAKYFPRNVQPPDRARFTKPVYHGQKLAGTAHDSQKGRKRVFKNIADGRAVVDEMSVDPEVSGVWHKQEYLTEKMNREDFKKLTEYVQGKYGKQIFGHKEKLSRAERRKLRQLTATVAGLDPWYAETKTPFYGRNFMYDYAQRLQDGIKMETLARTITNLVGETVEKGTQKASVVQMLDDLKLGTNQAYRKVISVAEERGILKAGEYKEFRDKALGDLWKKLEKAKAAPKPKVIKRNGYTLSTEGKKVYAVQDGDEAGLTKVEVTERNLDDFVGTAREYAEQKQLSVDAEVADRANRLLKPFQSPNEMKGVARVLSHSLNLFKTHATVTNPAFLARNVISAVIQNYFYDTFDPKAGIGISRYMKPYTEAVGLMKGNVLKGLAADLPSLGFKPGQDAEASNALAELVFKYGVIGDKQGYSAERVSQTISSMTSQYPGSVKTTARDAIADALKVPYGMRKRDLINPVHIEGFALPSFSKKGAAVEASEFQENGFYLARLGASVSQFSESFNRIAPFIAYLKQGFSPEQAAKKVGKTQVDYSTLSEAEKRLKAWFPFYTYSSRILPTTLENLIKHPGGKQAWTIRAMGRANSTEPDTPDYIQKGVAIPVGKGEDGTDHYLTGLGLPLEDPLQFAEPILRGQPVFGLAKEVASRMRPGVQAAAEAATGRSMFFERDLGDLEPPIGRTLQNFKEIAGGEKAEGMPEPFISRGFEWVAGKTPASRYINTVRSITDQRRSAAANLTTALTGVKFTGVSPDSRNRTAIDRASEQLKELGGRSREDVYLPDWAKDRLSEDQLKQAESLKAIIDGKKQSMKTNKIEKEPYSGKSLKTTEGRKRHISELLQNPETAEDGLELASTLSDQKWIKENLGEDVAEVARLIKRQNKERGITSEQIIMEAVNRKASL